MVEAGHFAELDNILRLTIRGSSNEFRFSSLSVTIARILSVCL